jgi:hypothetical protein
MNGAQLAISVSGLKGAIVGWMIGGPLIAVKLR